MAYRNERSSSSSRERLHYFLLPDNGLKWGVQRQLRCMKINPNFRNYDQHRSLNAPVTDRSTQGGNELTHLTQNQKFVVSPVNDSGHRGNQPVPDNSMVDLQRAAGGMRISMVEERGKGKGKAKVSEDDCNEIKSGGLRSWNLRTRRSACKAPEGNGGGDMMANGPIVGTGGSERGGNCGVFSPVRRVDSRLRSGGGMGSNVEQTMERPKFSLVLSKEEIENDFITMTGAKPPRRPKRRPKPLQRKLNDLLPGFWLREVTPETYKVDDNPEPRKGLK